jgi:hypothetical protein
VNSADYDVIFCPGPGEPHSLAVPKLPRVLFGPLICDRCHAAVRVDEKLRSTRARWKDPPRTPPPEHD